MMLVKEVLEVEADRLRGYLERLWSLTKSRELKRKECLNTINDIDRSLIAVILTLLHLIEDLTELLPRMYKGLIDATGVLTLVVRVLYSPSQTLGTSSRDLIFTRTTMLGGA